MEQGFLSSFVSGIGQSVGGRLKSLMIFSYVDEIENIDLVHMSVTFIINVELEQQEIHYMVKSICIIETFSYNINNRKHCANLVLGVNFFLENLIPFWILNFI